jgi:NRPS condensation-like uncharacterized protein
MPSAQLSDVALFGAMGRYGDLCIHATIDLRRKFSRAELERAMAATIADFPVLGHRYVPGTWRDRWVPVEGPVSDAVHVETPKDVETATAAWFKRSLVATRDRMVRLVGLERGDRMRLLLTISHLAVDGAGIAAVGHVLGAHLYGLPPALPVEERRDLARTLEGLRWFHLPLLAKGLVAEAIRPWRQLASGARVRDYRADDAAEASWRHVVIPSGDLARVRARCGGATVNDILIAALARVAAGRSRDGSVVITYTMDLRRYAGAARLMAANSSSILSAIVPRPAIGDLPSTVSAVSRQTERQRRDLAGPAFLAVPYTLGARLPHSVLRTVVDALAPFMVDVPLSRGLLVTNVGRIDEGLRAFGDDIEDIRILGPNIAGISTPVVVAFGFRGELHLELFAAPGIGAAGLDEMERELREALELS